MKTSHVGTDTMWWLNMSVCGCQMFVYVKINHSFFILGHTENCKERERSVCNQLDVQIKYKAQNGTWW